MNDAKKDSLWDLAPGVVHHLGNVLFTLQGRAVLLPASRERDSLLEGATRAQHTLQALRWMLGEGLEQPVATGEVVQRLVELLRVGYRENGISLLCTEAHATSACDPILMTRLLTTLCRTASAGVGGGGKIHLDCVDDAGELLLLLRVEGLAATLRFPLSAERLREQMQAELASLRANLTVDATDSCVSIRWTALHKGIHQSLVRSSLQIDVSD
ncbi:MAG: hypothetical protein NT107_07635 [Planctomycetota bacterium]|nr:hypothetical protein [Planctomycetota bacterium]